MKLNCVFSTPDKAALLKLIDVLRTVTAGILLTGTLGSSVVDPDLVGSETFYRIRIRKKKSGSGQLRVRNEFEVKLL
jgi:hypothetical protein